MDERLHRAAEKMLLFELGKTREYPVSYAGRKQRYYQLAKIVKEELGEEEPVDLMQPEIIAAAAENIRARWARLGTNARFPKNENIARWAIEGIIAYMKE